jgi:hypothetical protein
VVDLAEFAELHVPALEADEVRFNLLIAAIASALKENPAGFRHWALGAPGHCAVQWPGRAIVLGNLDQAECRELAKATMQMAYPGVVGSDQTSHWFVEHATAMGMPFEDPIPQRIHALSGAPHYPGVAGSARAVLAADAALLFEWLVAFHQQTPHLSRQTSRRPPPADAFYSGRSTGSPYRSQPLRGVCGIPEPSLLFTRRPSDAAEGMRAL